MVARVHALRHLALQHRDAGLEDDAAVGRAVVLHLAEAVLAGAELLEQRLHHRPLVALLQQVDVERVAVDLQRVCVVRMSG